MFSTNSGFNPDQFDIFSNIQSVHSKSPAQPAVLPVPSRPSTPTKFPEKVDEPPVINLTSNIPDDDFIASEELGDEIEFEEL
jgi:hypothetical protein